jgi:hypothetical protein
MTNDWEYCGNLQANDFRLINLPEFIYASMQVSCIPVLVLLAYFIFINLMSHIYPPPQVQGVQLKVERTLTIYINNL